MAEGQSATNRIRIAASYKRLAESATALNKATDEFTKPVEAIEQALRDLNVGVEAWEKVRGEDDPNTSDFWTDKIGFAKIGGKWRIALHKVAGNHSDRRIDIDERWPFAEGPRSLRIEAVDKLPDLVDRLIATADKTARKMQERSADVQALAEAVAGAANEVRAPKKGSRS